MATENDVVSTTAEDGVPDTSGGPVIDVLGHLRELRHAVLPALVVAVVLGVLVALVRSFTPETYERAATARISISSATTSETFAKAAAAQFESLGSDSEVLAAVAGEVGLSSADEVAEAVTVKANIAPGVMDVSARASNPELAESLVTTMIAKLDHYSVERSGPDSEAAVGIAADLSAIEAKIRSTATRDPAAAAELYAQREALSSQQQANAGQAPLTLTLLSLQYSDGSRVAPKPLSEGAVVALVAFLLALEGIVLFNSRGGRAVTPTWARRTGSSLGIEVDSAPVEDGRLPVATAIHVKKLRDEGAVIAVLDAALDPEEQDERGERDERDERDDDEVTTSDDEATATDSDPTDTGGADSGNGTTGKSADESAEVVADTPEEAVADTPEEAVADTPEEAAAPPAPPSPVSLPGVRASGLTEPWWEHTDLSSVTLAVLVVDEARTPKNVVLECLDRLAVAQIPTRLVVRESPDFSGPLAWLKT